MTAGLGLIVAMAASLMFAGPALAADDVYSERCHDSNTSLGYICVGVTYDNTNCSQDSTNDCVGLNGATVKEVEISTESGEVDTTGTLMVSYDVYGDGTSAYTRKGYAAFRFGPAGTWIWTPGTPQHDINRLCVRIRSAAASSYNDGINIGGMNPYGLDFSGACNLP